MKKVWSYISLLSCVTKDLYFCKRINGFVGICKKYIPNRKKNRKIEYAIIITWNNSFIGEIQISNCRYQLKSGQL